MIDLLEPHADLWVVIHQLIQKNRLPQAFFFVGPRHASLLQFANRLIATINCQGEEDAPCGRCRDCHLLLNNSHPDIRYIRPETSNGAIKIEQVRELQQTIYQTPQCSQRCFIVIDPADKMNVASSNALLKILEEPPKHLFFILIAEQISSILPTILSRCQLYSVPAPHVVLESVNYLAIGQFYPEGSSRAALMQQSSGFLALLDELVAGNVSPCTVAVKWASFSLEDVIWLLYLLTAQVIHDRLIIKSHNKEHTQWKSLSPSICLKQLDKISAIQKKMYHNVSMNQTLVLEDLLVGYL